MLHDLIGLSAIRMQMQRENRYMSRDAGSADIGILHVALHCIVHYRSSSESERRRILA